MKMSSWEKYLRDIYLDPSHPASFSNPHTLYKVVKKEGKHKISHSQIKKMDSETGIIFEK